MNDDHFERSADMRLLEHQRRSLGLLPQERPRWRTRLSASLAHVPVADEAPIERQGAAVACTLHAHPSAGLIAGAVVTVTIVLNNDGPAPAHGVCITLPLPPALTYRPASLLIDGREADARTGELFESGLMLGAMTGHQRTTILFKAGVRAGSDPIVLAPTVAARGAGVVGARPVVLSRSTTAPSAFGLALATEVDPPAAASLASPAIPPESLPGDELPFYELDEEETIAAEALDGALSPMTPQRDAPTVPAAVPEPVKTDPPVARLPSDTNAIATGGAPALIVTLAATKLAAMRQFFVPDRSFGMTAHYLLLTVLATQTGEQGDGALGEFFAAQERLLMRALIARKMGKPVALDDVAGALPPFPLGVWEGPQVPFAPSEAIVLYRTFKPGELDFLASAVGNAGTPVFVRAAQLAVGLAPQRVAAPLADGRRCDELLAAYANAAAAEINRLFVRARLDRKTDLFGAASPQLDERARTLLDALAP